MHIFCKKIQKVLHISRKSSIFAAGFNSGAYNVLNLQRVMEKVEICKVTIGTEIYKVNQLMSNDVLLDEYRVMHGRRIVKGGSWFNNRLAAIQFMLSVAFEDVSQAVIPYES